MCRDETGALCLAQLENEADGWQQIETGVVPIAELIVTMQWCQKLAGNPVEPWPDPSIPEPANVRRP